MAAFPKQCDLCQLILRTSDDGRTLECPQCGDRFTLRSSCPYPPSLIEEAAKYIEAIERSLHGSGSDLKQAVLWLLEEKWLSIPGHRITIKVGCDSREGPTQCNVCSKKLQQGEVFRLVVRDRWRESESILDLCRSHIDTQVWEGDMDVLCNGSLKLGPA